MTRAITVIGPAIEWTPYSEGSFNPNFTGYTAAAYCTGAPERGWCLYSEGAGGWNQRTRPVLPPEPGAEVQRVNGAWHWVSAKALRREMIIFHKSELMCALLEEPAEERTDEDSRILRVLENDPEITAEISRQLALAGS